MSPETHSTLFKPFQVNDRVHTSNDVEDLDSFVWVDLAVLDDMIEGGFDCVNPLRTSAAEMDPDAPKAKYGRCVASWEEGSIRGRCDRLARRPKSGIWFVRQCVSSVWVEASSLPSFTMCSRAYRPRIWWDSTGRLMNTAVIKF